MSIRVCIDAGHTQGYNRGVVPGYFEGNMSFALAQSLKRELESYGFIVILTRYSVTSNPSLEARGKLAGGNDCDVFLSLHSDASGNPNTKGVTVIRSLQRPGSLALGQKLAACIAGQMGTSLSPYAGNSKGVWTREYPGRKGVDYYGVIRSAVADPQVKVAFLIEHGFHTNPTECAYLDSSARRAELAAAVAKVLAEEYGLLKPKPTPPPQPDDVWYRVQVGAFTNADNASRLKAELAGKGYSPVVVRSGPYSKVQVGAFRQRSGAERLQAELAGKGYKAIIV